MTCSFIWALHTGPLFLLVLLRDNPMSYILASLNSKPSVIFQQSYFGVLPYIILHDIFLCGAANLCAYWTFSLSFFFLVLVCLFCSRSLQKTMLLATTNMSQETTSILYA